MAAAAAVDLRHGIDGAAVLRTGVVLMPDDALTTALKELGRAYEMSVRLRKLSADVQADALENEKAMWRCLSALRRLTASDQWVSTCADSAESERR